MTQIKSMDRLISARTNHYSLRYQLARAGKRIQHDRLIRKDPRSEPLDVIDARIITAHAYRDISQIGRRDSAEFGFSRQKMPHRIAALLDRLI